MINLPVMVEKARVSAAIIAQGEARGDQSVCTGSSTGINPNNRKVCFAFSSGHPGGALDPLDLCSSLDF
jgi:hypothetical protein